MMLVRARPIGRQLHHLERDLMQEMNRIVNEMRSWREGDDEVSGWSPNVNVYGKDDHIVVEADLPGMKKNEIKVSVQNAILTLSGERKADDKTGKREYFRHELPGGVFCRPITLPFAVDAERITANYVNGVLTLSIPKSEEAKTRHIEIH